ncbi:hypothetical protein FMV48_000186 [Enterococcus faecium]|nr:hypothetical protein [Enterococcus faecium]
MLNWPKYSIEVAESDFKQLNINNCVAPNLPVEFLALRKALIKKRDEVFDAHDFDNGIGSKEKYSFDLLYGLEIYELLLNEFNMANRVLTDDDVWRYLSVKIIPDVVHSRSEFKAVNYYQMPRRNWLKRIWWYIHVSWQGSKETTYEILKNNTTDTIMQLVERPGLGFNLEVYREIMKQYAFCNDTSRQKLRQVMILNTARIKTIFPELVCGGIPEYVAKLYEEIS